MEKSIIPTDQYELLPTYEKEKLLKSSADAAHSLILFIICAVSFAFLMSLAGFGVLEANRIDREREAEQERWEASLSEEMRELYNRSPERFPYHSSQSRHLPKAALCGGVTFLLGVSLSIWSFLKYRRVVTDADNFRFAVVSFGQPELAIRRNRCFRYDFTMTVDGQPRRLTTEPIFRETASEKLNTETYRGRRVLVTYHPGRDLVVVIHPMS